MTPNFSVVSIFQEHFDRYLAYLDPPPANTEILEICFQYLQENQMGEVVGWVKSPGRFERLQHALKAAN